MKLMPMAVCRRRTSPRPGGGSSCCCHRRTSGPPYSCSTMAFVDATLIGKVSSSQGLESCFVSLAGSNANDPVDVDDEDLAVTNLAGLGRLEHGLDYLVDQLGPHRHFDTGLGDE